MSASAATGSRAAGGVGLFGGTFDPVHRGHLHAAEEMRRALALDRLIFIPSARPPHKSGANGEPIAPARDRLAWLRQAVAGRPGFEVDAVEIERSGPSFAVDTVRSFRERGGTRPPVFVIGSDAFALIGTWREPEVLFELADFAVMTRPPFSDATLVDWIPDPVRAAFTLSADGQSARHRLAGTSIHRVEIPALDISSSSIRNRIARGEAVDELLPEGIGCTVLESRHYESDGPAGLSRPIQRGRKGGGLD